MLHFTVTLIMYESYANFACKTMKQLKHWFKKFKLLRPDHVLLIGQVYSITNKSNLQSHVYVAKAFSWKF